ncbi:hypothetical protein [Paenibacillus sp. 2KB_22]|uniref:hypothetical protein n=1 Tax=Paenibacillus sp. 2KB_22 TaxID=3232978 RepID=UPI003F98ABAF
MINDVYRNRHQDDFQFMAQWVTWHLVESFIVGPLAKKITFSLPFDKSNKILGVLAMSFFMVIVMVLIISLYGMISAYLADPLNGVSLLFLLHTYLHTVTRNFSLALPYQLIILGPLVRYIFGKFIKSNGPVMPTVNKSV